MPTIKDKLKGIVPKRKPVATRTPIWEGPSGKGPNGGVTFSLLSRFLSCRERFRLYVVEGLKAESGFQARIEYGQLWHHCEERFAMYADWQVSLKDYCVTLCRKYPLQQQEIDKWYNVCLTQFPIYIDYWSKHKDVVARTPLFQEQVFDVPHKLPSGRVVRLRGKWDGVDLIGKGKDAGVYLFETKTKGDIDEEQIKRQISFDLQTCMYLVTLNLMPRKEGAGPNWQHPIRGVRFNVVRRPLSGGKGTIKQHQPSKSNPAGETKEEFYARLKAYIVEAPETYFMRWTVTVTPDDIARFRRECLDPILENICDWWEWVSSCHTLGEGGFTSPVGEDFRPQSIHWRHPFGVVNSLDEGYASDLDQYLQSGSTVGLQRVETMFTELT